ncbi:geranyl transferase, partial [Candidatus Saganbacteria bacterium]|nr:geranyl transferase [Candidatus Saganbacteria bacterium]
KTGKPVGADVKKGFPFLVGLEKAEKLAGDEKNKAIAALSGFDAKADILREIAAYAVRRNK